MAAKSIGPGTVLAGRFRLEDLIQETAGAKFWRATDRTLARNVAVNVLDAADPRAEPLLVAARTSATVTDGHFLRVLDAAEEDGYVYVVNEWGSGISLDRMLDEGPLPARRAAWLVKEVADAITTAHRHGISHGRLLPENVMVTEAGSVKLIGFVVDAVLNGHQEPLSGDGDAASLRESDVLNLAALLYATLVGRWPGSEGSSLPAAPSEHGRTLRPRQVRAGVPRPLDAICDRVINAQHTMPINTAHEIGAALSDFIGDPTSMQIDHEHTKVLSRDDAATSSWGPADTLGGGHESPAPADPEATQLGAPVFVDDGTEVGGASPSTSGGPHRGKDPASRPAPPPAPPEPVARPLFAPDPPPGRSTRPDRPSDEGAPRPGPQPRPPTTAPGRREGGPTARRAGPGAGALPAAWGPDAGQASEDRPTGRGETLDAGKSWLRLAAIVAICVVLVFAIIVAFNFGRGSVGQDAASDDPSSEQSPNQPARPLQIAAVSDFDPEADPPEENPELARLAIDGDPDTAWETMTYRGNPQLGGLKDGVGLLVDLGDPVDVSEVNLTLVGEPTAVEILAADEESGAPTSADDLTRVASESGGPKLSLQLDDTVTTRYIVVWLTSLPAVSGGFQGQVAEIVVRS